MIREAIIKLSKKEDLTYQEAYECMNEIMDDQASDIQKAAYLTALSLKGETIDEITASAKGMREHCVKLLNDQDVLEIVGTGGDGSGAKPGYSGGAADPHQPGGVLRLGRQGVPQPWLGAGESELGLPHRHRDGNEQGGGTAAPAGAAETAAGRHFRCPAGYENFRQDPYRMGEGGGVAGAAGPVGDIPYLPPDGASTGADAVLQGDGRPGGIPLDGRAHGAASMLQRGRHHRP